MAKERLVYGLCDPRDGTVRYVGKSSSGLARPREHTTPSRMKREFGHKRNWLQALLTADLEPTVVVLERAETAEELNDAECFWIAHLRSSGADLLNRRSGGESDTSSNYTHPDEVRKKIAEKRKGYKHSPETRKKLTARGLLRRGRKNPQSVRDKISRSNTGKKMSESFRHKLSLRMRGVPKTQEQIEKIRATKTGTKLTEEHKANIGAGLLGHSVTEETRQKLSSANSGHPVSQEQRLAISKTLGGRPFRDETGRVYQTHPEAPAALGVRREKIIDVLKGRRRHTGGHTFVYVDSEPPADE